MAWIAVAGIPNARAPALVLVSVTVPRPASSASRRAARAAPCMGLTCRHLLVQRAYQLREEVTRTNSLLGWALPPMTGKAGALRPRGKAGAPWLRSRLPQIHTRRPSSLT